MANIRTSNKRHKRAVVVLNDRNKAADKTTAATSKPKAAA